MVAKYENIGADFIRPSPSSSSLSTVGKVHSRPTPKPVRHIWIVTGPAGCGKSSVAQYLANTLDLPYIEGDDVRPTQTFPTNPLTNANPLLVPPHKER